MLNIIRTNILLFFIFLIIVISLVFNLNNSPLLWFDEGWIMSVAQNWLIFGHYGQFLNGMPIPTGMLNAGFPVIGPITFSFASFGVGIWQGRLPSVLFAVGSFFLIYQIANNLYGRTIATGTLIIALFLPSNTLYDLYDINPIIMGRMALGEMPAMFYLLAGYFCLMFAWRSSLFIILAALFFGIAMVAKQQVVIFLSSALLIPLVFLIFNRDWHQFRIMSTVIIATLIVYQIMAYIQRTLVGSDLPPEIRTELYLTVAFVPQLNVHLSTFFITLVDALPTILGLGYVLYKYVFSRQKLPLKSNVQVINLSLIVFAATSFFWFVFLSIGWRRYLFPAGFISTIFIAVMLNDIVQEIKPWTRSYKLLINLLVIFIIIYYYIFNPIILYKSLVNNENQNVFDVANFINNNTREDSLIETYDKQLFIFLNRRYHYPPDYVQLRFIRRFFMKEDVEIIYDPLLSNPDYLVIGPFSRILKLYDQLLKTGEFHLLKEYSSYKIYSRVRN